MEALGRLAGGLAHDFNNLLTAIMVYCGLLEKYIQPESRGLEHLEEIRVAADRGASLVTQLLSYARRQVLEPQPQALNQVLEQMAEMLTRVLGEDIELEFRRQPWLGSIHVDRGQIEQVILNLALNARDAMPEGGRLTLETCDIDAADLAAEEAGLPPGDYVKLSVSDTGVGMDEVTRAHLFEPFFTTKEPGKGSGLGLATALGIVEQSGGAIRIKSALGQGAEFSIYLPRVTTPESARGAPPAKTRGADKTVLLVEDEDSLRPSLAEILSGKGYHVLQARHGGEGLRILNSHHGPIHLLITDLVMPVMGGRELADHARVLRPEMRVLFISGYSDEARTGKIPEPLLFRKPFSGERLEHKIREILERNEPQSA